jgi:hypothetical protein
MLGLFAPQIQWMEGRPGDAWGLAYLLLALLALGALWTLKRLFRNPSRFVAT